MFSIEDYIDNITDPILKSWGLTLHYRILAVLPQVESCLKFKTPFYIYRRWVCYWGVTKANRLELGFTQGYELSNEQGLLRGEGELKQVRKIFVENAQLIQSEALEEILLEAVVLNDIWWEQKKRKKPKTKPYKSF